MNDNAIATTGWCRQLYLCALLVFCFAGELEAQQDAGASLIAHWPLDGNGNDVAGSHQGVLASKSVGLEPQGVPGRFGQALSFSGESAVEIPINLDPARSPVTTISFWVKPIGDIKTRGDIAIVSTGGGPGPRIFLRDRRLMVNAGTSTIIPTKKLSPDKWHFVAVTWDFENGAVSLYQDNIETHYELGFESRGRQPKILSPRDPDAARLGRQASKTYLWIGAQEGIGLRNGAVNLSIDDMHLFSGRPSPEQLTELSGGVTDGVEPKRFAMPKLQELLGADQAICAFPDVCDTGATGSDGVPLRSDISVGQSAIDAANDGGPLDLPGGTSENGIPAGATTSGGVYRSGDISAGAGAIDAANNRGPLDLPDGSVQGDPEDANTTTEEPDDSRGDLRPTGQATILGVMGNYGDREYRVELADEFVYAIQFEDHDAGCALTLNKKESGPCGPADSYGVAAELPDTLVAGMRTCRKNDNRISGLHGIELSGNTRRNDGSYWHQTEVGAGGSNDFTCVPGKPDDDKYKYYTSNPHLCAANQFVVGLVVHTLPVEGIVGLQMICRRAIEN